MSLSATVLLGADDHDESPEHPKHYEDSARAKKAPHASSAEEVREDYQQALAIFQEIINGNLTLRSEVLIEQVNHLIDLRLNLYRLLVNDTQDPQMRAAYLASLLIDLERIIRQVSERSANFFQEFSNKIFPGIEFIYNYNDYSVR